MSGLLFLVSAPSGAGKTSLVAATLELDANLVVSVSHTTRKKRQQETDGVNYHFVTVAGFEQMVANGDFLEHANVFGNRYGTSEREVQARRRAGHDVVLEIDWQGAAQIRKIVPDAVSIFILPPSKQALRERLIQRGQDTAEVIEARLAQAELEMSQAPGYDYIVVNDDFDTALRDMQAVVTAERLKAPAQMANNPLVRAILS